MPTASFCSAVGPLQERKPRDRLSTGIPEALDQEAMKALYAAAEAETMGTAGEEAEAEAEEAVTMAEAAVEIMEEASAQITALMSLGLLLVVLVLRLLLPPLLSGRLVEGIVVSNPPPSATEAGAEKEGELTSIARVISNIETGGWPTPPVMETEDLTEAKEERRSLPPPGEVGELGTTAPAPPPPPPPSPPPPAAVGGGGGSDVMVFISLLSGKQIVV